MTSSKRKLTLVILNGDDVVFEVDEDTTTVGQVKRLFSNEAGNPFSDKIHPLVEDENGEFKRRKMLGGGKFMSSNDFLAVHCAEKIYPDDMLIKDIGIWELHIGIKDVTAILPALNDVTRAVLRERCFPNRIQRPTVAEALDSILFICGHVEPCDFFYGDKDGTWRMGEDDPDKWGHLADLFIQIKGEACAAHKDT